MHGNTTAREAVIIKGFRYVYLTLLFGFLLGISDGYITLWRDGSTQPLQVFPYQAQMLPEADQLALEKGIRIDSQQELDQLLEDYLS
ncbi:MAG: BofC C-terminal domain-containing protein [Oscillospiraceae bacterium]|nr:BofC C-terminal domain-containing protein [Oscillospiraceae bacterium]